MGIQQLIAPQQNSFMDAFTQVEAIKGARSANALNEAKVAELPYEREREAALNDANIAKAKAQTGKANAESRSSDTKLGLQVAEFVLRNPADELAVIGALRHGAQFVPVMGQVADNLESLRGTPAFGETAGRLAMTVKDKAAQQMEQEKFTEQKKQSGIDNTFQQGNLNVAQGSLAVSQANAAETRRHHGVVENKPDAGFSMSYDAEGRPVISSGPMPKLTEAQGKATSYAMRGGEADGQLEAMEADGYRPGVGTQVQQAAGKATGAPDRFMDATGQKYNQSAGVFINAINRQDSGAAIPEVEWERAGRLYLVQPGDSDAVIEQKRQARKTALEAVGVVAGPGRAALPPSPNLGNVPALPQRDLAPGPARMEPIAPRATNPSTGEVLELQGGRWQPVR